jgi:hypothetical protein
MLCETIDNLMRGLFLAFFWCAVMAGGSVAGAAEPLYKNDFEKEEVDKTPGDFLVIDGNFSVKKDEGNKFLELPGDPNDAFGVLFGPTEKTDICVTARIFGTGKGRRFPAMAVGLGGVGGYKLQLSPSKKLVEIYRGEDLKASVPFEWLSGKWAMLRFQIRTAGAAWKIEGKVWAQDQKEPAAWTITFDETQEPTPGRPSVWASPHSGTPIRFDDFVVTPVAK